MKKLFEISISKNEIALAIDAYGLKKVEEKMKSDLNDFIDKTLIEVNKDKKLKRNTELLKRMYEV